MNALVVEGVTRVAEELLISLAAIQRRVVLAGHKMHGLDSELTDDLLELGHPCSPQFRIISGVGQVSGEDYEVRLLIEAVDRCDGFPQRALRVRVDLRPIKAPMGIRNLDEIKILPGGFWADGVFPGILLPEGVEVQSRSEHDTAQSRELQKIPTINPAHRYLLTDTAGTQSASAIIMTNFVNMAPFCFSIKFLLRLWARGNQPSPCYFVSGWWRPRPHQHKLFNSAEYS